MDFNFSDDQNALRDVVNKWVEKDFPFDRRHKLAKAGGMARVIYKELADLGLTGMAIPESFGGMGMGPVEAMVVMEEMGRGLVNVPFAAAALVSPALLSAAPPGLQEAWFPRMASGEVLVVPALQERNARYEMQRVCTQATFQGSGFTITGQKSVVPSADEADAFIVPARLSGSEDDTSGIALFLVEASAIGVKIKPYATHDGARAGELVLDGATATLISESGWPLLEQGIGVGIAAACAEGVGAMDQLATITAAYLNTRKQFGVALASFQVLRHRIADVKLQQELARSMSYYATLKLAEHGDVRRRALCQAKLQLGRSARIVAHECIQMHGGIGLTDEYIGSHYFKRLTVLEMAYGDTQKHRSEVSRLMLATAGVHP